MSVNAHRGNLWYLEIVHRIFFVARAHITSKRQDEASKTCVYMQTTTPWLDTLGNVFNGINDTMWVTRCRCINQDHVSVQLALQLGNTQTPTVISAYQNEFDIIVVGRFVYGSVCGDSSDPVGEKYVRI